MQTCRRRASSSRKNPTLSHETRESTPENSIPFHRNSAKSTKNRLPPFMTWSLFRQTGQFEGPAGTSARKPTFLREFSPQAPQRELKGSEDSLAKATRSAQNGEGGIGNRLDFPAQPTTCRNSVPTASHAPAGQRAPQAVRSTEREGASPAEGGPPSECSIPPQPDRLGREPRQRGGGEAPYFFTA